MKKTSFSVIIFFAVLTSGWSQGQRWIKIKSGNEIPSDAVVGGKDGDGSQLFVARANYGGNWHPGKTRKDWNTTSIEYGNQEVNAEDYQILVGSEGLSWVRVSQGNVPDNAVIAGHENQNNLYSCRADYQGSLQVGKTWQGMDGCRIGYGGGGQVLPNYEVLVHSGSGFNQQPGRENSTSIIGTWVLTTSSNSGCDSPQMNYPDSPCKDQGIQCATVVITAGNTWSDNNGGKGSYSIDGDKITFTSAVDGSFSEFNFKIVNGVFTKTQRDQFHNCLWTINYKRAD